MCIKKPELDEDVDENSNEDTILKEDEIYADFPPLQGTERSRYRWSFFQMSYKGHCIARLPVRATFGGVYYHEIHYDVTKWKHFPRYWSFVVGGHRWIPVTKGSDAELCVFFYLLLNKGLSNHRDADDSRRHCAHYDVTVMKFWRMLCILHYHRAVEAVDSVCVGLYLGHDVSRFFDPMHRNKPNTVHLYIVCVCSGGAWIKWPQSRHISCFVE